MKIYVSMERRVYFVYFQIIFMSFLIFSEKNGALLLSYVFHYLVRRHLREHILAGGADLTIAMYLLPGLVLT